MKLCLIAILALLAGCAHTHRYGDATYREPYGPQPGLVVPALSFPPASLATAASTTIRVRELPGKSYPRSLRIPIAPAENLEGRTNQPWRTCKFTVTLVDARTRKTIYHRAYDLSAYIPKGSTRYRSHSDKYIYLPLGSYDLNGHHTSEAWAAASDYDIIVKVQSPSRARDNILQIESVSGPLGSQGFHRETVGAPDHSPSPSVIKSGL